MTVHQVFMVFLCDLALVELRMGSTRLRTGRNAHQLLTP